MLKVLSIFSIVLILSACGSTPQTIQKTPEDIRKELTSKALNGNIDAQFQLAKTFCCGKGPDYDNQLYVRLTCDAAKKGHSEAQYTLAKLFEKGMQEQNTGKTNELFSIELNISTAHMWYSVAAQEDYKPAVKSKKKLAKRMGFEQLNESMRLRSNWKTTNCDGLGH